MIRNRDIVAAILVLILARMSWDASTESLKASAQLAFFMPRDGANVMAPLDVDGDGTVEALAILAPQKPKSTPPGTATPASSWILKILDLKPLHQYGKSFLAPFQPKMLFTSGEIKRSDHAIPIKLKTGQVLVNRPSSPAKKQKYDLPDGVEINDRNRNYFCGDDWHDASQKCGTPCPGGQATECPDNERCFADTPCDVLATKTHPREETQSMFQLTPGGGLPSVIGLWSNGEVTLHSLTSDELSKDGTPSTTRDLKVRQMWHTKLLPNGTNPDYLFWEESNVLFLDADSSHEATNADHGVIVVSGTYIDEEFHPPSRSSFAVAVEALSGEKLWESFTGDKQQKEAAADTPLFPIVRGTTSYARRRSRIPNIQNSQLQGNSLESLPNCLVTLRHHLKEVMPYAYWGPLDSKIQAIHLDLKSKRKDSNGNGGGASSNAAPKPGAAGSAAAKMHHQHNNKKKWHHKHKHGSALFGRPNMLVSHTGGGLQIRSLKNGMPLCHLSLLGGVVYSDLNSDGILDQVQILLETTKVDPKDTWVWNLAAKIHKEREDLKEKGANKQLLNSHGNLCHAMATSGLPPKEELFSSPLCGSAHERIGIHPAASMDTVTPLVVESLNGRRNTRDLIIALNNGLVHRLHGGNGRREWMTTGKLHESFPTWEAGSNHNVLLTRVDATGIAPPIRPVLLAGENSLAILSVKNGGVLASVPFPQTSIVRPELADLSGDGSLDVVTMSMDGIWGFQVKIRPGPPVFSRIMSGLVMMLLMLAVLRNRFGQKKDIRATDD